MRNIYFIILLIIISNNIFANKKRFFSFAPQGKVEVININGKVDIEKGNKSDVLQLKTKKSLTFNENNCKIITSKPNNKLFKLEVKNINNKKLNSCGVDLKIKVPKQTSVKVVNGIGKINIEDIIGDVNFTNGSGKVEIEGNITNLKGKNGHGKVEIEGLTGNADIILGSGEVEIKYFKLPNQGEFKLGLGSGDIKILLPKESRFKTNFLTGTGKIQNMIGENMNSKFLFNIQTGVADLKFETL